MQQDTLITKYRPIDFNEVIGNQSVIQALKEAIESPSHPRAFLFSGPSGVGKTTLSRIIAGKLNASIEEIDAASHSSVEDTRRLADMCVYRPITIEPNKMFIIDECHGFGPQSSKAWQPLLKLLEDAQSYLYFSLCTTELKNVPENIRNRCYPVSLKKVKQYDIENLLSDISEIEKWELGSGVLQAIVQAADGSPRQAISLLQAGHGAKNREELSQIIFQVESENNPAIKLIGHLMRGQKNWKGVSQQLKEIEGNEEEAIIVSANYLAASLMKSDELQAKEFYEMLRAFTETETWNKKIHYYTAIGKILWGQIPF